MLFLVPAALLLLTHAVLPSTQAQSGGAYDLTWNVIAGGGAAIATGGAYTLSGGFWAGSSTAGSVYLPLIVR